MRVYLFGDDGRSNFQDGQEPLPFHFKSDVYDVIDVCLVYVNSNLTLNIQLRISFIKI